MISPPIHCQSFAPAVEACTDLTEQCTVSGIYTTITSGWLPLTGTGQVVCLSINHGRGGNIHLRGNLANPVAACASHRASRCRQRHISVPTRRTMRIEDAVSQARPAMHCTRPCSAGILLYGVPRLVQISGHVTKRNNST